MLIEPGNPEHLAGALRRLIRDRSLAARLATAARAQVQERYSFDRMVEAFEDLYTTSVASRSLAGARRTAAAGI
jgi:glycosyltransferase involved in cell wall biosynthesis